MLRFTTIRRRLLLGAGSLLVLSGLSLCVVHTALVRRFVLIQIQTRLGNAQGLVLEARDLHYNLFTSRFELSEVVLRGAAHPRMAPPLTASRIVAIAPVWSLLRGSVATTHIRVEGLALRWITDREGRTNWPALAFGGGAANSAGPSFEVTGGSLTLQDDRSGVLLALANIQLNASWKREKHGYAIAISNAGGELRQDKLRLPLDRVELQALAAGNFAIDALHLTSGASQAHITGLVYGTPALVKASATLDLEMDSLSRALSPGAPVGGRVKVRLDASGRIDCVLLAANAQAAYLSVSGIPVRRPSVDALIDTSTGEVRIRSISAGLFGGQLTGQGETWIGRAPGRSQVTVNWQGLSPRMLAEQAFGYSGFPAAPVAGQVAATWPGLNWRIADVSGAVRSQSARLAFRGSATPGSVQAALDANLEKTATVHGDVAMRLHDGALSGRLRGSTASFHQLAGDVEELLDRPTGSLTALPIDGTAEWSGTIGGTLNHPAASVDLGVTHLNIGEWKDAELRLKASYEADRIAIENARASWAGQQLDGNGEIARLSADAPLRFDGAIEGPSLTAAAERLGVVQVTGGALSGNVRVEGSLYHPTAQVSLQTGEMAAYGQHLASINLNGRWQDGVVTLTQLTAAQAPQAGSSGQIVAEGSLALDTGQYRLAATGENFRASVKPAGDGPPVTAVCNIVASGEGTLADPVLTARVTGTETRIADADLGTLRAEVRVANHQSTVHLVAPTLSTELSSTIAMTGTWPFQLDLDARGTHLATSPAVSFDATAHASGSLAEPHINTATAHLENLRIATPGQETESDGPIDLSLEAGRLKVARLALKSGASALTVSGAMPIDDAVESGSITVKGQLDLQSFSNWIPGIGDLHLGGVANVNATVSGNALHWQPSGVANIQQGRFYTSSLPMRFEDIAGPVHLENGTLVVGEITGKAGSGLLKAAGSVPLALIADGLGPLDSKPGQPARFSAHLENLVLAGGAGESAATATLGIQVEGEAAALSVAALRANVELKELSLKAAGREMKQTAPTRIQIAEGVAKIEKFELQGPESSLQASGVVGLTGDSPLQFGAAGQADLAFLSALAPPLEAAGRATLDLRIGGTLATPQPKGFVQLENGSLSMPDPRVQAANIKLRAEMDGEHVAVKEFAGNVNGGTFSGGGDLKLDQHGVSDANLYLKGKDAFAEFPAGVKTTSSLDLKLISRGDRLVLEGQVDVQEGYFDTSVDLFRSTPNFGLLPLEAERRATAPLSLDVGITTKRPVEMDNNLGRISGTANLRLGGSVDQPRLTGELQLEEDGRLYFGDRTYYIERGTVRFLDGPEITPDLNVQAYTRTNDYTIRLTLAGDFKKVTTTFTSDPPLSRDDVIAVLLTGKTVAENRGVDLRALEATSLATGALNATLSSKLNRSIGVSRVSIQPGAVAAESNPGARITITQDFTRSLRLLYSMNLSDSNDQIWVGEYDLSRHLTTRAVKQSDNTYRGEFRHDIRFGSSTPSTVIGTTAGGGPRKIAEIRFTGGGPIPEQQLAKAFKLKVGQKYQAAKVRKGSERLSKNLVKKGYLESRVRLDRDDTAAGVAITVRIELGPIVQLAYQGAGLSKKQRSRVRTAWHAGISDQQRPVVARNELLTYFLKKGYLEAKVQPRVSGGDDRKLVTFDLKPGVKYRRVHIVMEGAEAHRAREIPAMLRDRHLALAVYRDPAVVIDTVTGFYQKRGYLAAKVEPPRQELDGKRKTGRVIIPVKEGPAFRVGNLTFSGNRAIASDDLLTGLALETGAVFEPARLEPAVAGLKLQYGKLGYRQAEIEYAIARQNKSAVVDISFAIVENRQTSIGTIKVEGNLHTTEKFARSQLKVKEGQVANSELVRESVKNLSQTGAYGSADVVVQPPPPSGASDKNINVADLVVAVTEPKPFRLLYGGLYDSGNGPGFIADFQNHNSLGAGRVLGLRTRVDSETDEARLYLTRPFWRQKRLSTTFAAYFTRETKDYQTTPTETLGASVQQDVQLRSKLILSYGYRFERQRGFVPDPAAPDIPEKVVSVAPATLTITRDTRDSFLDASRGSFISHGFELAPRFLGSDYPYLRYFLQYFKYFALTRPRPVPFGEQARRSRLIFATGFRAGLQKGFNSTGAVLTDRFYAGGGTTVRGFRQDELGPRLANGQPAGGNAVLVLNQELRYPVFWIFDAVTFVDIGNVFPRVSDFRLSELRSAGGFGLRIRNPFVVLRFDYGFKFNRRPGESMGAFFFSIGQAF